MPRTPFCCQLRQHHANTPTLRIQVFTGLSYPELCCKCHCKVSQIHTLQIWGLCCTWPGELTSGDLIGMSGLLHLDSSAGLQSVATAAICHSLELYLLQIAKCKFVVLQSRKGSLCIGDEYVTNSCNNVTEAALLQSKRSTDATSNSRAHKRSTTRPTC